jgi:type II secretory ATPase GspE/PulE/Tfp pilus assembly ATPase PilB-like protein
MITFDDDIAGKQIADFKKEEEEDVVRILAENKYNIPYIDLGPMIVDNEALRYISEKEARENGVAPFKLLGKSLHVGILTPQAPGIEVITEDLRMRGITPTYYMVSHASLEKVWGRYSELSQTSNSRVGGMDISGDVLLDLGKNLKNVDNIKKYLDDMVKVKDTHKTSRLIEIILAGAIAINASDVHMEPEENFVRLRLRIDGVLQDIYHFGYDVHKLINSRLKLMSGMKLSSNAIAQDGRFSIFIGKDEISMRVSIVPGAYGEGIVMRILNPKSIRVNLEQMGIDTKVYDVMMKAINAPNGLILITGPTGSGKTTTLYAFLSKIYSSELKMMTIEDPVDYHLEGITQTQVETEKGYTFAAGLRAAMRQDPDVIMVGEIRDNETANTAIEASNTGHLVFSTLHTNSAAGVVPRLIDLGVNPKILVSALKLSLAQRLCRVLCTVCKKATENPDPKRVDLLRSILKHATEVGKDLAPYQLTPDMPITLYEPVGCDKCNMTGYKGRIGIFEAIHTDEAMEKLIVTVPSEREVKHVAELQGLLNMREDGTVKIVRGLTSFEEVANVVDLNEE